MWDTVDTEHRTVATVASFVLGYASIVAYMLVLNVFYAENRHSFSVPVYYDTVSRVQYLVIQLPVNF